MLQLPAAALKVFKCHFWRFMAQFSQDTALLLDSMISRNSRTISTWKDNDIISIIQMCLNHVEASSGISLSFFQFFWTMQLQSGMTRMTRHCKDLQGGIPLAYEAVGSYLFWSFQKIATFGRSGIFQGGTYRHHSVQFQLVSCHVEKRVKSNSGLYMGHGQYLVYSSKSSIFEERIIVFQVLGIQQMFSFFEECIKVYYRFSSPSWISKK